MIDRSKINRDLYKRIQEAHRNKPTKAMFQDNRPLPISRNLPVRNVRPPTRKFFESTNRHPVVPVDLRDTILITGSVGDFLALESYFSDKEIELIKHICYATRQHEIIREIFFDLPNYQHLSHTIVWDDFSKFFCFMNKSELSSKLGEVPLYLQQAADYSIAVKFPQIHSGQLTFRGSSLLKYKIADISQFDLPAEYAVICPYSTDKRSGNRDFNLSEWNRTIEILKSENLRGIVLNCGNDPVPDHDLLVNLSNLTTFSEAVEILKSGRFYFGIDSSISVLASQIFEHTRLRIKSINSHLYNNKTAYYGKQTNFSFLSTSI